MNKHLAKDLERYADMLAEGELISPDDLNCSAVMRLAAEALAQPEQEPVAWGVIASNTGKMCQVELDYDEVSDINSKWLVPLYTTPPQRTWVGLTDEEINKWTPEIHVVIRSIEAQLKEKNT